MSHVFGPLRPERTDTASFKTPLPLSLVSDGDVGAISVLSEVTEGNESAALLLLFSTDSNDVVQIFPNSGYLRSRVGSLPQLPRGPDLPAALAFQGTPPSISRENS